MQIDRLNLDKMSNEKLIELQEKQLDIFNALLSVTRQIDVWLKEEIKMTLQEVLDGIDNTKENLDCITGEIESRNINH